MIVFIRNIRLKIAFFCVVNSLIHNLLSTSFTLTAIIILIYVDIFLFLKLFIWIIYMKELVKSVKLHL